MTYEIIGLAGYIAVAGVFAGVLLATAETPDLFSLVFLAMFWPALALALIAGLVMAVIVGPFVYFGIWAARKLS